MLHQYEVTMADARCEKDIAKKLCSEQRICRLGEAELAIFKNEKIVNGLPTVLSFQHEDVSTY